MKLEQLSDLLQKLPDSEFEKKIFNSIWQKYPAELLRDEMIRRLRLRKDLSLEQKKLKFREIIDLCNWSSNTKNAENMFGEIFEQDASLNEIFQRAIERSKVHDLELNEHHSQLHELQSKREDQFEGKSKPGDWRPDGTELCPACNGKGKGAEGRSCQKCIGRGYIRL